MDLVSLGALLVGPGAPCVLIAEAGVNHDGDPDVAFALVDAAASAGADLVKFQTFSADRLVTAGAPKADYQLETSDSSESQHEMLRKLELPLEVYPDLVAHCAHRGIGFLSTPFDEASVAFLVGLGAPALKIPSGELTNRFLLEAAGSAGLPVILSTGMGDLDEVRAAVGVLRDSGADEIVLLHCVSAYPAQPAGANLKAMGTLALEFDVPVGFSDHTLGTSVALASVALGANLLEKHLTVDRSRTGPDHRASLEPDEFAALVQGVREVEVALGDGVKRPTGPELEMRKIVRKSLVANADLPVGTILTRERLAALRPGTGIVPMELALVEGRRLRRALGRFELVERDDLE